MVMPGGHDRMIDMPLGDFAEAGTVPKPLPIGRIGRFVFGAAYPNRPGPMLESRRDVKGIRPIIS